ncbi:MAG: hypothetical protein HFJ38_07310 [Bacilli bacterium]|nr:hypothetical protein [Bacilli bacterium]
MKNFLEYYYNFTHITVHETNGTYSFYFNHSRYLFVSTFRNIEEINTIYKIGNVLDKYHQIVLNRNHSCVTLFNNRPFVLLRLVSEVGILNYMDFMKRDLNMTSAMQLLLRSDWAHLIEKKIDYIEYQRQHFNKKYFILDSSLDYYIGMSENAISYIHHTIDSDQKNQLDRLVVSHRRILDNSRLSFYNPLDIIIDHPVRDICGYLKYLFVKDVYNMNTLTQLFNSIHLSSYGYRLLFGRMLYPSFYFDLYEKIVNEKEREEQIVVIIKRQKEYENYLSTIYNLINKKIKIPSIDWI